VERGEKVRAQVPRTRGWRIHCFLCMRPLPARRLHNPRGFWWAHGAPTQEGNVGATRESLMRYPLITASCTRRAKAPFFFPSDEDICRLLLTKPFNCSQTPDFLLLSNHGIQREVERRAKSTISRRTEIRPSTAEKPQKAADQNRSTLPILATYPPNRLVAFPGRPTSLPGRRRPASSCSSSLWHRRML